MSTTMFPDRSRSRRRAPVSPDAVRRYVAAALMGVAAAVTALVLADLVPAGLFLVAAWALILAPLTRWGFGLLETVAPLPDVHTPPVATATGLIELVEVVVGPRHLRPTPYTDPLLATAEDAGVYRHGRRVLVPGDDAPTTTIPQVQA